MKSWLSISCVILLTSLCSYGQLRKSDPLVLTGTIVGLNAIAECSGTEGRILVRVELAMQFRNDGDRPLIVFKPRNAWPDIFGGEIGSRRVNLLRSLPSSTDKEVERVQVNDVVTDNCRSSSYNYSRGHDSLDAFIKRIDVPVPSSEFCQVIEPRGYHEFREVITLDAGFDVDVKTGSSLAEARIRSGYRAFQLQYQLSLRGNTKGEGLLKTLQSRWKPVGDLVVDGNGDFTLTSQPIINRNSD